MNLLKRIGWAIFRIVGTIVYLIVLFIVLFTKPLWKLFWRWLRWGLSTNIKLIREEITLRKFAREISKWWIVYFLIFIGGTIIINIAMGHQRRLEFPNFTTLLELSSSSVFISIIFITIIKRLYKKEMLINPIIEWILKFKTIR